MPAKAITFNDLGAYLALLTGEVARRISKIQALRPVPLHRFGPAFCPALYTLQIHQSGLAITDAGDPKELLNRLDACTRSNHPPAFLGGVTVLKSLCVLLRFLHYAGEDYSSVHWIRVLPEVFVHQTGIDVAVAMNSGRTYRLTTVIDTPPDDRPLFQTRALIGSDLDSWVNFMHWAALQPPLIPPLPGNERADVATVPPAYTRVERADWLHAQSAGCAQLGPEDEYWAPPAGSSVDAVAEYIAIVAPRVR